MAVRTAVVWILAALPNALAFTASIRIPRSSRTQQPLYAAVSKLTPLPKGINPFVKGEMKSLDLSGDFRTKASGALQKALKDSVPLMEIEFPPLLFKGKTQYDDFDNVQELDLNRDWCIEWLPKIGVKNVWLLLPDLKECELAKEEWRGGMYRNAAQFTTIEQVTQYYAPDGEFKKAWGATFSDGVSNLFAGGGLLGDSSALDELEGSPDLHLICQPGNGGPVEDWINCEVLHNNCATKNTPTLIVNGALDKVRDGYYPALVFPALAKTVDRFYRNFESIFYLRPLSDKGLYGWLYRVYPEPWQVVLQTVSTDKNNRPVVDSKVVFTSDMRPTFPEALTKLVQASKE